MKPQTWQPEILAKSGISPVANEMVHTIVKSRIASKSEAEAIGAADGTKAGDYDAGG